MYLFLIGVWNSIISKQTRKYDFAGLLVFILVYLLSVSDFLKQVTLVPLA